MDCFTFTTLSGLEVAFGEVIGEGQTGTIRLCHSVKSASLKWACKTISTEKLKQDKFASHFFAECNALIALSGHENVINLVDSGFDQRGAHLLVDWCAGGTLFQLMLSQKKLEEHQVAFLMRQILLGLRHCHSTGVVHRDIKPENILLELLPFDKLQHKTCPLCLCHGNINGDQNRSCLSSVRLKVADFGFAANVRGGCQASGLYGSPLYIAPEVILGERYGTKIDMWGLGIICFTALGNFMPFYGDSTKETFEEIIEGNLDFNRGRWPRLSHLAKDFVSNLLCLDKNERMSAEAALDHPWITQFSSGEIQQHKGFKFARSIDWQRSYSGLLRHVSPTSSLDMPISSNTPDAEIVPSVTNLKRVPNKKMMNNLPSKAPHPLKTLTTWARKYVDGRA
eukprot:TRINITY_DN3990_c0_g1_i1.p1 TRINITY_DN3990_c0_g1~~TRINITY_DN3990_c0_g1_i1.p1  ORF type:complete len:417 (+),score=28.95 TRINITY_DN3990_c0_g1_i1:66-1253(+)